MKPRTKVQHEVSRLNDNLQIVQKDMEAWAFKECNEKIGIATKKQFWCIDCGDYHPISLVKNGKTVCPGCKEKLTIVNSRKRTFEQRYWVAFSEICHGDILGIVQVVRLFEVQSYHHTNRKPKFIVRENVRQFIPDDHNKVQYVARTRNLGQGNPHCGDLEIRKVNGYYSWAYDPNQYRFHPGSIFKEQYSRKGINKDLQGLTFLEASKVLSYSSKAETLLKLGEYALFAHCYNSEGTIHKYWSSIKIALRNRYKIEDAGVWVDYVQLLDFFNKDIRSPKYICPKDLKKEHDRYVKKKIEHDRKIKLKKQREKIIQDEKKYKELKKPFFGIAFSNGDITIKVLESVKEFMEQGDILKHCVFANEYYKKSDSLVFAAYVKDEPVETVEVSLKSMEVIQSRGLGNNPSPFNSDIKSLLNSNMVKIRKVYESIQKAN